MVSLFNNIKIHRVTLNKNSKVKEVKKAMLEHGCSFISKSKNLLWYIQFPVDEQIN